jgi:catechol-2,3-dioxygenase
MPPALQAIDHIHVFVGARAAAEQWYASVLGLKRAPELEHWAADGGPLTLTNASGSIHLALFERTEMPCRSTVAMRVDADSFVSWQSHLREHLGRDVPAVDHDVSWSLYFSDPDRNPYEITCYDYSDLLNRLQLENKALAA